MNVLVWLADGTWQAAVDAVRLLPASEVTLLHVDDPTAAEGAHGAWVGLVGRGPRHDPARPWPPPPRRPSVTC